MARPAGKPSVRGASRAVRAATEDAEQIALARDQRDAAKLTALDLLVSGWLDVLAPLTDDLEHPRRRWQPADLLADLQEARASILAEMARLKGPAVIEDSDT